MKIKNETLKKLTNEEANNLDLMNIGCMFVRGEAKQRVKGLKTTFKSETEMHYTGTNNKRVELIALASKSERYGEIMQDWCVRIFDIEKNEYENFVMPLFAIKFVK